MSKSIQFFSSNDPQINPGHIRAALHIAESEFNTLADPFQIDIGDENVLWTIQHIPFCWTFILVDGECVGSAAVLPTTQETMTQFLNGSVSENALIEKARAETDQIFTYRCLYLSGVTVLPKYRKQGLGSKALIHTIEAAKNKIPSIKELYCWPYTEAGADLIKKIKSLKGWTIQEFKEKS